MKNRPFSPKAPPDAKTRRAFDPVKMMAFRPDVSRMTSLIVWFALACATATSAQSTPSYATDKVPAPISGEAPQDRAPTSTSSGWQLRAIAGEDSNPNPEHSSGTPFKKGDDWHRYARVATISFDPPLAGEWNTTVKSVITVDTVVSLEVRNPDTKQWTTVPGKPLFTARYSRFVEARIDDMGDVTFDFDDGSPPTDPNHHLAATIVPDATGQQAVTISGPHGGAPPYNLPPDTMNARCTFQKRKGPDGDPTDVTTNP
jgi:hypothetical protein